MKYRSIQRKTKRATVDAIIKMMQPLANTITLDNGSEFAGHGRITSKLEYDIYFAKPYHSWERGTNEHFNDELQRYYPKSEPFDRVERDELDKVEHRINTRYRKKIGNNNAADRIGHLQSPQL